MKFNKFYREVEANVFMTREDIDLLMEYSKKHYDDYMNSLSEVGGRLYGISNGEKMARNNPNNKSFGSYGYTVWLTSRDLNEFCKLCEIQNPELYLELRTIFQKLQHEREILYQFYDRKCLNDAGEWIDIETKEPIMNVHA